MAIHNYDRTAARLDDLERPAQDVVNMCRDLYRLTGRIAERAKTMAKLHPEAASRVLGRIDDVDSRARRMAMDLEEALGLD